MGENTASQVGGNVASGTQAGANTGSSLHGLIYQAILKHKTYPRQAQMMRAQGRVVVTFRLRTRQHFDILQVSGSSGFTILDNHAMQIIRNARPDFPAEAIGQRITVPINFNLKE